MRRSGKQLPIHVNTPSSALAAGWEEAGYDPAMQLERQQEERRPSALRAAEKGRCPGVALGTALALFKGKPLRILGLGRISVRLGVEQLAYGARWPRRTGASMPAGIGFTMSPSRCPHPIVRRARIDPHRLNGNVCPHFPTPN